MGLFDRLKSNKNNKDFFEWLDLLLKNELSSEIKAIIFNLYGKRLVFGYLDIRRFLTHNDRR